MEAVAAPISPAGFKLTRANSQLIVGLPNTDRDFENSWDRGGFARQFRSPDEWRLTLREAIDSGVLRDPKDVWKIFDYPTRRNELGELARHGMNLSIGASIKDLPQILSRPVEYTKVWTHTHEKHGKLLLEFTDGFLSCDALSEIIARGQNRIIDFCACSIGRCIPSFKHVCPDRFFIAFPEQMTGFGWGLHTTHFMKNVVQFGGTFPEIWRMTLADLEMLTSRRRPT